MRERFVGRININNNNNKNQQNNETKNVLKLNPNGLPDEGQKKVDYNIEFKPHYLKTQ